jgi:hypothetical protein
LYAQLRAKSAARKFNIRSEEQSQEAHVHKFIRTFRRVAAVAAAGAIIVAGTAQFARAQAPEKKVKDQGEFDIYNQTLKDAQNPTQQIKDLDTWTQKYPDSDYKDDRLFMYVQAYNGANQPAKVLETADGLMKRDIKSVFLKDPKAGPSQVLTVLYLSAVNYAKVQNATPEQTAIAEKASKTLLDYIPEYFTAANKQANVSDADWAKTKGQVSDLAKGVLMSMATRPAAEAMAKYRADKNPDNCKVAEAAYRKALEQYPDSASVAYGLGGAQVCLYKVTPEKINSALWMLARAVAIDPTLGGTADAAAVEKYLNSAYTQYHGADDAGLKQLKDMAKASVNPPADFKIKSQTEIAHEKEVEFEKSNPQLAMWMKIKGQLADQGGEQYFDSQLKSADLPPLKGTVLEAKPACRSKELVIALSDATHGEITLKLDAALTGKPETGTEVQFKGVPAAFSKEPFMLTMDAEKANIEGLKTSPCAAAPVKKAAPKAAPKKK